MVNYQNGKIYKIINENDEIVYIGSSAEYYLSSRYAKHKYKAPNHKIILIENYPCSNCEELRKREQEIIEEHSNLNLLNIMKAYQSVEDFKNRKSIRNKKYNENHKNTIKEKKKEYYENNKNQIYKKINCEFCNCLTSKLHIKRHQKSIKCMKFQFIED